jgi:tetratricopeptide (TPR) repeat protein
MKYFIFIALILSQSYLAQAQGKPVSPKAKEYFQEALTKYGKYVGKKDSMAIVFDLLNKAIKEDSRYYEALAEIVAFHCQLDEYNPALQTIQKMVSYYPKDIFVTLLCGAIQYKTGHKKEAYTSFNKVIALNKTMPSRQRNTDMARSQQTDEGVAMILIDKPAEGKAILKNLYKTEKYEQLKSRLAHYINSDSKDELIDEIIPGKWN